MPVLQTCEMELKSGVEVARFRCRRSAPTLTGCCLNWRSQRMGPGVNVLLNLVIARFHLKLSIVPWWSGELCPGWWRVDQAGGRDLRERLTSPWTGRTGRSGAASTRRARWRGATRRRRLLGLQKGAWLASHLKGVMALMVCDNNDIDNDSGHLEDGGWLVILGWGVWKHLGVEDGCLGRKACSTSLQVDEEESVLKMRLSIMVTVDILMLVKLYI